MGIQGHNHLAVSVNWGPILGAPTRPCDKDHAVFGSIWGAPVFGNSHLVADGGG